MRAVTWAPAVVPIRALHPTPAPERDPRRPCRCGAQWTIGSGREPPQRRPSPRQACFVEKPIRVLLVGPPSRSHTGPSFPCSCWIAEPRGLGQTCKFSVRVRGWRQNFQSVRTELTLGQSLSYPQRKLLLRGLGNRTRTLCQEFRVLHFLLRLSIWFQPKVRRS